MTYALLIVSTLVSIFPLYWTLVAGSHTNHDQAAALLDTALGPALSDVAAMESSARLEARYQKFRAMGQIGIESPVE